MELGGYFACLTAIVPVDHPAAMVEFRRKSDMLDTDKPDGVVDGIDLIANSRPVRSNDRSGLAVELALPFG